MSSHRTRYFIVRVTYGAELARSGLLPISETLCGFLQRQYVDSLRYGRHLRCEPGRGFAANAEARSAAKTTTLVQDAPRGIRAS